MLHRLGLALSSLLVFAVALAASPSCKTAGTPKPVDVVISGAVDCAEEATRKTALHILDDAASALVTGDWQGALADLASRFGAEGLACALGKIRSDSTTASRAAMESGDPDKLEDKKAARASQWLDEHRVSFVGGGAP